MLFCLSKGPLSVCEGPAALSSGVRLKEDCSPSSTRSPDGPYASNAHEAVNALPHACFCHAFLVVPQLPGLVRIIYSSTNAAVNSPVLRS